MSRFRVLILFFLISILAFSLRFYRLTTLPPGLGRDEVSVAYNAYSILTTGRDEHGRFLPLYFEAIGDQKLPVIIYLTAFSVKLFGLTALGARAPFAFLGFLTVVFLFFLLKEGGKWSKNYGNTLVILAPFFLAVNPWQMAHSRAVYEITAGTFLFTLGTYCFLKGLASKRWFISAIVVFILAFYTYSLTRLLSPLLFFYYLLIFRKELGKFNRSFQGLSVALTLILLIPFVLNFFDPGGIYGPKGAVIFSATKVRASILEFRSYVVNTQAVFLAPLFFNRIIMTTYEYGKNLLAAVSPEFYFARGSDVAGIGTNGQFYMIEIIPFLIGLISAFRLALRGDKIFQMLLGFIALTIATASLTVNPPYATRTLFMVVPMTVLIAWGWMKLISKWMLILITLVYFWHFNFYLLSYYVRFPVVFAKNWESETGRLFEYLKKEEGSVDRIIITRPENSMYAFYLFYNKTEPEDVWRKLERYLPDTEGWTHGKTLGKYEFRQIDWKKDVDSKYVKSSVILVSFGDEYPQYQNVTKELEYPLKYTVFPDGQKVIAIPERRVAYRIWKYVYDENEDEYRLEK